MFTTCDWINEERNCSVTRGLISIPHFWLWPLFVFDMPTVRKRLLGMQTFNVADESSRPSVSAFGTSSTDQVSSANPTMPLQHLPHKC